MTVAGDIIKNRILEAALPDVPFEGWTAALLENAAVRAGYSKDMAVSVFPDKVSGAITHMSDWADQKMLVALAGTDIQSLRIRDRIALAVRTRFEILSPHKEAERLAISHWLRPFRKWKGMRLVWKTADVIWVWAGDTSTDYNRYTKRTLLSGVLTATTLFWLTDSSKNSKESWDFLDRRIEDVMKIGKIVGRRKTA